MGGFLVLLDVEDVQRVIVATGDEVQGLQVREESRVGGVQHHQGWRHAAHAVRRLLQWTPVS